MGIGGNGTTVAVRIVGDVSGLPGSLATVETTVGAKLDALGAQADKAGGHLDRVTEKGEKAAKGFKSAGSSVADMVEGFAGFEVAKDVVDEFDKTEAATRRLSAAMAQAGEKDSPRFREELERSQQAGERLGFSAGDTTDALAKLRLAGVDTSKGMEALPVIMDLARARNIDLATATDAVVQGMQGQGKALKALNIELPGHLLTSQQLASAQAALAVAQDAVNRADSKAADAKQKATDAYDRYSAAATRYGENSKQALAAQKSYTAAVQANDAAFAADQAAHAKLQKAETDLSAATADVTDRTHNLGAVLDVVHGKTAGQAATATRSLSGRLSVLKTEFEGAGEKALGVALPALTKVTEALGFLTDHMNIVIPVMGVLLSLFVLWKGAMLIGSLIEGVTTAVRGLNVTLSFLAANPIVLVIAAVAALVAGFVILEAKFHFIEAAARAVFDWLKDHWPLLLDILLGPFGLALGQIIQHWNQVSGFFGKVVDGIKTAFGVVFDIITGPFRLAFDAVADMWNSTLGSISFTVPGWVPGLGGKGFSMPKLPHLHAGGLVPGLPGQEVPIIAMAGERVVSANRARRAGGGHQIIVNAQTNADPFEIGREVAWALKTAAR